MAHPQFQKRQQPQSLQQQQQNDNQSSPASNSSSLTSCQTLGFDPEMTTSNTAAATTNRLSSIGLFSLATAAALVQPTTTTVLPTVSLAKKTQDYIKTNNKNSQHNKKRHQHQHQQQQLAAQQQRCKRVKFEPMVNVIGKVAHGNDHDDDVMGQCWYGASDYYLFEKERQRTLAALYRDMHLLDTSQYCLLGLEQNLTYKQVCKRKHQTMKCRRAVLAAQRFQRRTCRMQQQQQQSQHEQQLPEQQQVPPPLPNNNVDKNDDDKSSVVAASSSCAGDAEFLAQVSRLFSYKARRRAQFIASLKLPIADDGGGGAEEEEKDAAEAPR